MESLSDTNRQADKNKYVSYYHKYHIYLFGEYLGFNEISALKCRLFVVN